MPHLSLLILCVFVLVDKEVWQNFHYEKRGLKMVHLMAREGCLKSGFSLLNKDQPCLQNLPDYPQCLNERCTEG